MDALGELRRICGIVADDLSSCTHVPGGSVCSSCTSAAVRTLRRAARGGETHESLTPGVRNDAYLSRKAQGIWPSATVLCRERDGVQTWVLQRKDCADLDIGSSFGSALESIESLRRAERARGKER